MRFLTHHETSFSFRKSRALSVGGDFFVLFFLIIIIFCRWSKNLVIIPMNTSCIECGADQQFSTGMAKKE